MSPSPRISVVVPVCNAVEHTQACLADLAACDLSEVIVVDNGSTDGTREWLEQQRSAWPWLRVLSFERNRGFAAACSAGLDAARGAFHAVLNNDTRCEPDLFELLLAAWKRSPRTGLVAPVSNYVRGRQLSPVGKDEDLEQATRRHREENAGVVQDVDTLTGLCLLAHADLWREVGGLDADYGIGNFEDDDLCLRVRRAGYRLIIAHDAFLHHDGNATFKALGIDYDEQYDLAFEHHAAKWGDDVSYQLDELRSEGRWPELFDVASEVAPTDPAWAWSRARLARAANQLGRLDVALRAWPEFLRHCPMHTEGWLYYTFSLLESGREAEGRCMLAEVLSRCFLDPVCAAGAFNRLARHWHGKDPELAEAQLQLAFDFVPDFRPAKSTKAVWLIEDGAWAEAEALLQTERDSDDPDVWNNLGIALFHQGRQDEAVDAFRESVALAGAECPAVGNLRALGVGSATG